MEWVITQQTHRLHVTHFRSKVEASGLGKRLEKTGRRVSKTILGPVLTNKHAIFLNHYNIL